MNRTIVMDQGLKEKFEELLEEQLYNAMQDMAEKKITRATINTRFVVDLTEMDNLDDNGRRIMVAEIPLTMAMRIENAEGPKEVNT